MEISRVSHQNGGSLLYIMLEIHHSVWEFSIWIQPFQAETGSHKGGHSLQIYSRQEGGGGGFASDGLPCVCIVEPAVVEALLAFPAESLIGHQIRPDMLCALLGL